MAKEFVLSWERANAKTLGDRKSYSLSGTLPKIRNRLSKRRGDGYKIGKEGEKLGQKRNLGGTMDRLRDILPRMKVGEMTRVRALVTGDVLRIYCVQTHVHAALPSGAKTRWHKQIQHGFQATFGEFQRQGWTVAFGGAENCRMIRGSSVTWSMHSWWPPVLAIDIFVPDKRTGDALVAYLKKHLKGDVRFVWWTTLHYDHIHVQIGANRSGRPACA